MNDHVAGAKKPTLLDGVLAVVLAALFIAYILAGGTPDDEWRAAPGNALFGLNVIAWGAAVFLAYLWPDRSVLLRGLAWVSSHFPTSAGPIRGPTMTLCWSVILLFAGALMFITGAGLA